MLDGEAIKALTAEYATCRGVAESEDGRNAEEGFILGKGYYYNGDVFFNAKVAKSAEENLNSGGKNACCKSDKGCLAPVPTPSA